MNNYHFEYMSEKEWELARNKLERLLLSGLMYDDWRIKQVNWIPKYTKIFYGFFKYMRDEQVMKLIEWCNLCEQHDISRCDIKDLIDAWNAFITPPKVEPQVSFVH